jgi:hypothetical protein
MTHSTDSLTSLAQSSRDAVSERAAAAAARLRKLADDIDRASIDFATGHDNERDPARFAAGVIHTVQWGVVACELESLSRDAAECARWEARLAERQGR